MWTLRNNVTNFPFHPLRQLFLVLKSLCFKWSSGPPHNFSSLSKVGPNLNLMDWKTTFTLQTKLTELRQEKYRKPTLYWLEFVYIFSDLSLLNYPTLYLDTTRQIIAMVGECLGVPLSLIGCLTLKVIYPHWTFGTLKRNHLSNIYLHSLPR